MSCQLRGWGTYCFWCRSYSHWHQRLYRHHTFLSAQYLMNHWLNSYQSFFIYNWDVTKNLLDFGGLDQIFKVTAVEKLKIYCSGGGGGICFLWNHYYWFSIMVLALMNDCKLLTVFLFFWIMIQKITTIVPWFDDKCYNCSGASTLISKAQCYQHIYLCLLQRAGTILQTMLRLCETRIGDLSFTSVPLSFHEVSVWGLSK